MSKLNWFRSKLKWLGSKPQGFRLVFTLMGAASLFIFAASQQSEASETLQSSEFASDRDGSPAQRSAEPTVRVQFLPSTESRLPSETRLEAPVSPDAPASGVRAVDAPAAAAVPSTPANNGPTPAEVAAYIARALAKIRQGDIASARRLLERASSGDEAEAWLVLAETYDPRMLAHWGVLGIKPDLEKSKAFYQEAQRRGAQGARERLLTLSVVGSPE
jgi:TPR repeat protein